MNKVEAYEVNGRLFKSKKQAEIYKWAQDFRTDCRGKLAAYAASSYTPEDIITWLSENGWKAP